MGLKEAWRLGELQKEKASSRSSSCSKPRPRGSLLKETPACGVAAREGRAGALEYIRSDNGPELIARAIQSWPAENKIKTI